MGQMIAKDIKNHLKTIANSLNTYIESDDFKYFLEIERYLEELFESQNVKFWKFDERNMQLTLLDRETEKIIQVSSSLTQQVIDTKTICVENHVTSNKYYNADIDNALKYKIKSLIFYPILKGNKVIGILKLWRGLKQRKKFVKKDETNLSYLAPLLLDIMEHKSIDKNDLLTLLNEKPEIKKETFKIKDTRVSSINKKIVSNKIASKEESATLEMLKNKLETLEQENKEKIKTLTLELETKNSEIKQLEDTYKILKEFSADTDTESQKHQDKISKINEENRLLSTENKDVKKELKKLKESISSNTIKQLKSERALISKEKESDIDINIEHIFRRIDTRFNENEYAHVLFEILIYALASGKGMEFIEENLKKTKLVQRLIDGYYFKGDLLVCQEKYRIEDFVKQTKVYEKDVFTNMIKLDFDIDTSMPMSLVLDAEKIQNIILHLLVDFYQFVDHSKKIDIRFYFKNNFFTIEIGGEIHRKNSLFQSMFKQAILGGDEKSRLGLQLSKKVATRLKGGINTFYEDDYYKFIVSVPAQVIKM